MMLSFLLLHFILKLEDTIGKLLSRFSKHLDGIGFAFYGPITKIKKKKNEKKSEKKEAKKNYQRFPLFPILV